MRFGYGGKGSDGIRPVCLLDGTAGTFSVVPDGRVLPTFSKIYRDLPGFNALACAAEHRDGKCIGAGL